MTRRGFFGRLAAVVAGVALGRRVAPASSPLPMSGTYANGDMWVVGPVTIPGNSITLNNWDGLRFLDDEPDLYTLADGTPL